MGEFFALLLCITQVTWVNETAIQNMKVRVGLRCNRLSHSLACQYQIWECQFKRRSLRFWPNFLPMHLEGITRRFKRLCPYNPHERWRWSLIAGFSMAQPGSKPVDGGVSQSHSVTLKVDENEQTFKKNYSFNIHSLAVNVLAFHNRVTGLDLQLPVQVDTNRRQWWLKQLCSWAFAVSEEELCVCRSASLSSIPFITLFQFLIM